MNGVAPAVAHGATRSRHITGARHAYRKGEVLQRGEGVRIYPAGGWFQGRVRPHRARPSRRTPNAARGGSGFVRRHERARQAGSGEPETRLIMRARSCSRAQILSWNIEIAFREDALLPVCTDLTRYWLTP